MPHRELLTESQRLSLHAPASDERGMVRHYTLSSEDLARALLPGINRRPNLCPPGTGPTLALAQARKVDVILVTELTCWGRSAWFAARSLTCFKFRFVFSPQVAVHFPAEERQSR